MSGAGSVPFIPVEAPIRVLVIEDSSVDRDIFRRLLEQSADRRFEFTGCSRGKAALEHLRSSCADCVLLDLNLPDMDGLDVLRSIMRDPDPCPVIVITAFGSEQTAVEAMKAGAADYLVKGSISEHALERAIQNAIEKRSLRRDIEQHRKILQERNQELESALDREYAARRAVEQSEERYRVLAEAMPQIVWSADPKGKWNYVNERWIQLTGVAAREAFGDGWLNFIDPEDRQRTSAGWRAAVQNKEAVEFECRLRASTGEMRLQLMRAVPVLGQGSPVLWVGTFTDIEEQRRTEELLRNRQKLDSIGILAAGVAHDFNNLLVGIVGGVSYALEELPQNHPLCSVLELALKSGERGADLTRQLMAYAGQEAFHAQDVNLAAALHENEELMRASLPRSIDLRIVIPPDLPPVHADPTQLQQVVMNLVLNAGEAIPDERQGIIVISAAAVHQQSPRPSRAGVAPPGKYIAIEVRDNGTGIDPGLLQKIFDPFFTTKFAGRGLGLAAVQGIVRTNRGSLEVESTVGKGTAFRVLLPAGEPLKERHADTTDTQAISPAATRILVVDDEAVVRSTAKAILQRLGHAVDLVSSGQEAVERVRSTPESFSLVLLDYSMPGLSGTQTFDAIHSMRPDLPIVVCSGFGENEIRNRFTSQDVAGFIQKPFRSETLSRKVTEILVSA